MRHIVSLLAGTGLLGLAGCGASTSTIPAVMPFELDRYAGKWYEIARLDHAFERGLEDVTAEYTPLDDKSGEIKVVNRGYHVKRQRWSNIEGTARQPRGNIGQLEVTFFWPIRAGYKVIVLDEHYQWALVTSDTMDYLWILAREPQLPPQTLTKILDQARDFGFNTDELMMVSHDRSNPEP